MRRTPITGHGLACEFRDPAGGEWWVGAVMRDWLHIGELVESVNNLREIKPRFSLLGRGVTHMEREKIKMSSGMLDWNY